MLPPCHSSREKKVLLLKVMVSSSSSSSFSFSISFCSFLDACSSLLLIICGALSHCSANNLPSPTESCHLLDIYDGKSFKSSDNVAFPCFWCFMNPSIELLSGNTRQLRTKFSNSIMDSVQRPILLSQYFRRYSAALGEYNGFGMRHEPCQDGKSTSTDTPHRSCGEIISCPSLSLP